MQHNAASNRVGTPVAPAAQAEALVDAAAPAVEGPTGSRAGYGQEQHRDAGAPWQGVAEKLRQEYRLALTIDSTLQRKLEDCPPWGHEQLLLEQMMQ